MAPPPPRSLWEPFDRPSRGADLLNVWDEGGYTPWSWDDWRDRSLRFAGGLRSRGIRPGDRVAALLTNSPDACAAVLGVWLAGACLVSLPLIPRGMDLPRYASQLRRIVEQAEPTGVLADASLVPILEQAELGVPIDAFQSVAARPLEAPEPPGADAAAFVQYSSGSTTDPKGCVLTPRAIAHQLAALQVALEIDPERDTGVVWLPLSHDMGLFGCLLLSYWTGHPLALGTPQRFLAQPGTWLEDCARFQATVGATPGFALDLAARLAKRRLPPPIPMRALVVGGERVEPGTLAHATAALGPERLPMSAIVPAYGLAEAVLAVTMARVGDGPSFTTVDADALAAGELVPQDGERGGVQGVTATLTSAGQPLPGNAAAVVGESPVGEIRVSSPSMAAGYLGEPEATRRRFTGDGLMTGDIGFVVDGELFVAGRTDDLMPFAGRNVYARDVEVALSEVAGVRPGNCAVVDVANGSGTRLIAVVEPRTEDPDFGRVARRLARSARAGAGVKIDECVFVRRGGLPKTPSGKVQRFRCREIARAGADSVLTRIAL